MRTFVAVVVVMLTITAYAEDMQSFLEKTQELVREGKYQEALERFIWFHDHALEHDPAMYGVRLSFALSYWKQLGEVYPPAKMALVEVRDRKARQIENGDGSVALFHDVEELNRTLEEEAKTVELFRTLDTRQPALAKQCWDTAKESVIATEAYDLVRKYIGNPVREFTKVKEMYDYNTTLYDRQDLGGEHFKTFNEDYFVEESLRLIKVALAMDDRESAKEIQEKALAVVHDYRLEDAIPEEAK